MKSAVRGTPGRVFRPGVGRSLRRTSQYASVARLAGAAHRRSRCVRLFARRYTSRDPGPRIAQESVTPRPGAGVASRLHHRTAVCVVSERRSGRRGPPPRSILYTVIIIGMVIALLSYCSPKSITSSSVPGATDIKLCSYIKWLCLISAENHGKGGRDESYIIETHTCKKGIR